MQLSILGFSYNVSPEFANYSDNNATALILRDLEDGGTITTSINVPGAQVPDNDHIAVKNYAENDGLDQELIRLGLIEKDPVAYAHSGFVSAPIYKLTQKALNLRDEDLPDFN